MRYCICLYPDFNEAMYHLKNKIVKIYHPEQLRGGGLLKYAYLKQHGFQDDPREAQGTHQVAKNAMVNVQNEKSNNNIFVLFSFFPC